MSPQEYADVLRLRVNELVNNNLPLKIAATTMTVRMSSRIFVEGKDESESKIGDYSTKGIYLSDSFIATLPKVQATRKGKTGKSKFKDGREHKTTYFEGWKGVRDEAGRQTAKVDLSFIGDLQSEFTNSPLGRPASAATPRKIDVNNYEIAVTSETNVNKARGNEGHFGKVIFTPSKNEKELFYTIAEKELRQLLA